MTWRTAETDDRAACHALRRAVFIAEQGICEADQWDDLDAGAMHPLASDGARPVGPARLLVLGGPARLGRICVLPETRGPGLGASRVRVEADRLAATEEVTCVQLGAQIHPIGFHEKFGFTVCGPEYDEVGIPHVEMGRPV